jgi:DNA-directed RNA polymerase specialized sigma24 family protein
MLHDPDLAGDAVQEAVVVALVSLPRLRSPERFGSWLCGITLNVARRWLREVRALRATSDLAPADDGPRPDEAAKQPCSPNGCVRRSPRRRPGSETPSCSSTCRA